MKPGIKYKLRGLGFVGAGLILGHFSTSGSSIAQPQVKQASATDAPAQSNADRRIVAYIYGNIPIYRDEFGEYLMARRGAEKFNLFINKRIIEAAAAKRGITVTGSEIEAIIDQDCANVAAKAEFLKMMADKMGVSIYEWKEDVIKPRIMLYKMGKEKIDALKIEETAVRAEFDKLHARRVKVKIVYWPASEEAIALREYDKIRKSETDFDRYARNQFNPNLAAKGGEVLPFAKGTTGDKRLEEEAFKLQPGETSPIIKSGAGVLIMRCIGYDDGPAGDFEKEKAGIEKALREKMIEKLVPEIMKNITEEAKPQKFFEPPLVSEQALREQTYKELVEQGLIKPKPSEPVKEKADK